MTGEPFLLLHAGALESALQRPRNLWAYEAVEDVGALAVRLMMGIARDHPFMQGNKRTGFEAALIFLIANGHLFDGPPGGLARAVAAVTTDEGREPAFARLFGRWVRPL